MDRIIKKLGHAIDERIDLSLLDTSDYGQFVGDTVGICVSNSGKVKLVQRGCDFTLPNNLTTDQYVSIAYSDEVRELRDLHATYAMLTVADMSYDEHDDYYTIGAYVSGEISALEHQLGEIFAKRYSDGGLAVWDVADVLYGDWHHATRLYDWPRYRANKYLAECDGAAIDALADEIYAWARESDVYLVGDVVGYLRERRDELRDASYDNWRSLAATYYSFARYDISYTDKTLRIGCQTHSRKYWQTSGEYIAREYGRDGDLELWQKHRLQIFFAMSRYHSRFGK